MIDLIEADWPAPPHVHAYTTTRHGGYSLPPFESLNLGDHCGDNPADVETNRDLLKEALGLPAEPLWLEQVHKTELICADTVALSTVADGSFAKTANKVCVVMTADCLPILMTDTEGTVVAAIHAGWRGLAAGIIEKGVKICKRSNKTLMVWLGPAIGPESFEIGDEVKDLFVKEAQASIAAFKPSPNGKWLADIYLMARLRLERAGVTQIYGGDFDTFKESNRFYSYRRDRETGRMASLIWLTPQL